jgi:hypothetical protein
MPPETATKSKNTPKHITTHYALVIRKRAFKSARRRQDQPKARRTKSIGVIEKDTTFAREHPRAAPNARASQRLAFKQSITDFSVNSPSTCSAIPNGNIWPIV